MNKTVTKLCVLIAGLVVFNSGYAQLSITGQAGGLKFLGDVGQKNNSNFFSDMRLGYNLGLEYRIGKVLGVGIDGMYGHLAGTDNDKSSHLNFQSQVMGGGLNVYAFFDKLGSKDKDVSPYIHAGFGYLMFDPYGDMRDKNGTRYNYWADGSIRNLAESTQNEPLSTIIKRDYTYETQLKDSAANYSRNTFYVPLGIGAKFNMGFRASLRVGVVYNLCLSDYIDNYKKGGNDSWASANIALNFNFAKKPKDGFSNVNFQDIDNSDLDGDGVKDLDDRCQGTPKGLKVDGKGCPDDTDNDGVFDYMDKEVNSKKGAKVDAMGVTIDEELMAKRQMEWDSLSSERSEGFNNAPSVTYLETVESKSKENKAKTGTASKIPTELLPADINKDGYISAKEITQTIDAFFEGDNSFNVERLNRLIDYFFEQ
jgi:opacity protein-like surface antigen